MNLREISMEIDRSYEEVLSELQRELTETKERLTEAARECHLAASQGDLSENTAYADAKVAMAQANASIASLEIRLGVMGECNLKGYKTIGCVVLFTTFTVRRQQDGKEFTFKLFPEGISDISKKIISKDSLIGKSVWMKKIGDSFTIQNRVTAEPKTYVITDLY